MVLQDKDKAKLDVRKVSLGFCVVVLFGLVAIFLWCFYPRISVDVASVCVKDKCNEKVFLLNGEVTEVSWPWVWLGLELQLSRHPEIKTVCIASQGGVSSDAMFIADNIYAHGFNTCLASKYRLDGGDRKYISGLCQSACIWMMLAGRERILFDDGLLLGFHAARNKTGGRADDEVKMFNGRIDKYTHLRSEAALEAWKLTGLTWWAFHQGAEPRTKDCTAHEVQTKYPYFTDIRSWAIIPNDSCGLQAPEDVKRSFD